MTNTTFDEFVQDAANRRVFEQESLAIEAAELISQLMEQRQIRKADLAKEIGKSKAFVTQVLSGSRNMTMHTFADLACALGHRIVLNSTPLESAGAPVLQSFTFANPNRRYVQPSAEATKPIAGAVIEMNTYAA